MHMDVRMRGEEGIDQLGLVGREVVGDHMDLFAARLMGDDVGQKGDEFGRRMSCGGLAEDFAGLGIEGGVQRQRAVTEVLEPMTLRPTGGKRQHGILAIQRLDRRLFIDAEHYGVLRWIEVQPDNVGRLVLEIRIVGRDVTFKPMRLDAVFGPDARDRHVRDTATQFRRQLARGPVRRSIRRLVSAGARQYARLNLISHLVPLTAAVPGKQAGQPIRLKALAPTVDIAITAIKLRADLGPSQPIGTQQDQPRVPRRVRPPIPRTCLPLQFHPFSLGQLHRALPGRDDTTDSSVTLH